MSTPALPPLTWLRAFEAAARHLSFTAAATELHLTQSAISQHVRSLESFLGKPMFVRHTRALSLTEDGANYLPAVREAFNVLAAGAQPFVGRGGDAQRTRAVTLQCSMGFAVLRLTPRLGALASAHPKLRLNIVTPVWDPEKTAQMADVEIRFTRPEGFGQDGLRLTQERAFPVCTAALAERIQNGEPWHELPLFDCVGVLSSWQSWLLAHEGSREPVLPLKVHMSSTFAISIGAALAGEGLAMAHDGLVGEALADGRLVRPFKTSVDMSECYALYEPANHMRSWASQALTEWLIAEFADPDVFQLRAEEPGREGPG
ncbi:LysR family transcriptional regulator [Granulosicoccus antarcticus]|uniref:Glycine cleavage system transcriptional activator n=1 Tax=Granulosicoccus antarcticus IMCC3135 TaxID=1192854 RepID=A0A2Z2NR07_9GAMM|nr:LysR family transcriptional regulator [Granulosicoccus antarcticus]ASJ73773.1 Glycine cleavage system transcriptional activator [Granulosicoccus antarcticus IMCC3135]